jgi:hypothetical protein
LILIALDTRAPNSLQKRQKQYAEAADEFWAPALSRPSVTVRTAAQAITLLSTILPVLFERTFGSCGSLMASLKNAGHLLRMAAVFAAGIVLFLIVRSIFVPKTFGQYGHYRGAALAEIAAKPIMFAGHSTCESCHADISEVKSKGVHAHVACESCHGPLGKHADDPSALQPPKMDVGVLCVRCHEANPAKPRPFPQVVSAEHSGGVVCDTCHQPHSPRIAAAEGAKAEPSGGGRK